MKVLVWNEFIHEKKKPEVAELYPNGMHNCIADFLRADDIEVRTATLDDEECGLTEEVLAETDVLIWWGHAGHNEVPDEIVERIHKYVVGGMGLIALHSAHFSKIFKKVMGTSCTLKWRNDERERIWTIMPNHPIAEGVDESFVIENEEMYGEPFDIAKPDDVIFIGWFKGGEVFRSGCTWTRGNGKVFYFQPGHETNPIFHNENVQKIIRNAVRWACPIKKNIEMGAPWSAPVEE
ncbi:MAG: ThuA domain-containing protein [Clostridia bacterium]|nr:ThuA domain-containing protein [Clostridia bacterium]